MLHSRPTFITYKKVRKEEKLVSVIENEKWLSFSLSEVFFFFWYMFLKRTSVSLLMCLTNPVGLFSSGISDSIIYFFSFVLRTGADGSNDRSPLMREYCINAADSRSKLTLTENISLRGRNLSMDRRLCALCS